MLMKMPKTLQLICLCLALTNQALAASPSPARSKKTSTLDTTITQKVQKVDAQARKITVQSNRNRIDNHEARKSSDRSDPNNIKNERNNPANDEYKQIQNEIKKAICEANCNLGYDCVPHKNGFYACVPPPSGFLFPECETKSAPNGQNCIPSWSLKIQSPGNSVTSFSNYTHYAVQSCVKDADCGGWDRVCYKENICVDPNSNWLTTSSGKWDSAAAKPGTQQGALSADDVSASLNKDCDLNANSSDQCETGENCYLRCEILDGYQECRDAGNPVANCDAKFKKCNPNLKGVCAMPCTDDAVCNDDDVCDLNRGHCVTAAQQSTPIEAKTDLLKFMATAQANKLEYHKAVQGCSADDFSKCIAYDAIELEKITVKCPEGKIAVGAWGANVTHEPIAPLRGLGLICSSPVAKAEINVQNPDNLALQQTDLVGPDLQSEWWTKKIGVDEKSRSEWLKQLELTSAPRCPNDPMRGMGVLTGIRFRHWYNRVSTWQISCGYLNIQQPVVIANVNAPGYFGGLSPAHQCIAPFDPTMELGDQCTKKPDPKKLPVYQWNFENGFPALTSEISPLWDWPALQGEFDFLDTKTDCGIEAPFMGDECDSQFVLNWTTEDMVDDNKASYDDLILTEDIADDKNKDTISQDLMTGIEVHYSDKAIAGFNLRYISFKDIKKD